MSSDEANSSPTDVADFEKAKAQIHAKHGDIVLECVGLLSQDNHTAHTYAFDVHIQRMAACSGFFEDMLEASHPGETDVKGQDLQTPIVRMEEDWRVVLVLIAWAYNKREILKLLPSQTSWSDLLDVYKASHKYSFHTLAPYVSILLR